MTDDDRDYEFNARYDDHRERYGAPCPGCGTLTWGGDCPNCYDFDDEIESYAVAAALGTTWDGHEPVHAPAAPAPITWSLPIGPDDDDIPF